LLIVDNTKHIVSVIESESQKKILAIKNEFEAKKLELDRDSNLIVKQEIDKIENQKQQTLLELEKERTNNFELEQEHKILHAKKEVHKKIMDKVLEKLGSDPKIIKQVMTNLSKQEKIKEFHIPKVVKIPKAKSILNEPKVIGIVKQNFELEFDLKTLLVNNTDKIEEILNKELWTQ